MSGSFCHLLFVEMESGNGYKLLGMSYSENLNIGKYVAIVRVCLLQQQCTECTAYKFKKRSAVVIPKAQMRVNTFPL